MSNTPTRLAILCAPRAQQFCNMLSQFRHLEPLAQCACGPAFHGLTIDSLTKEVWGVLAGVGKLNEGRDSSIWLPDWEGIYREFRSFEPGIEGGRVVRNRVLTSEDFSADVIKTNGGSGTIVAITDAYDDGPKEGMSAARVQCSRAGDTTSHYSLFRFDVDEYTPGTPYKFSFWAKSNTGSSQNFLTYNGPQDAVTREVHEITTEWQRFTTFSMPGSSLGLWMGTRGSFGGDLIIDILISGGQVEYTEGQSNQNPSEYVPRNVGVESGIGADGVAVYACENGNTVLGDIVIEAVGSDLSENPWLVHAPAATNLISYARDLRNAFWNATNVTVAKNVIGIDGAVNAACTLTASAGDGTVIANAVTAASGNHSTVWFIKRNTGTDKIELTLDNGATWQDVTAQVDSGWTQIAVDQEGVTNPQVGIRIATSGNSVYVDHVAVYKDTAKELAATLPPIPTSGAPASRLACDLSFDDENHSSEGSLDCEVEFPLDSADMSGNLEILSLNGGPSLLYYDAASGAFKSTDGTNTAEKAQTIHAGVTHEASVWHAKSALRVGVDGDWGAEQPYEGVFPSGSALDILRALSYVGKIRDIRMY